MAYIGQSIKNGTFTDLGFTGTFNSSTTDFNLGTQVGSAAQLLVSKNGVIQRPGTDFTLASGGSQISFTTAPASGDSIFIVEISGAVGGPMNRDINGDELILDVDGDTSIQADTDDQIDIKIAGADDFKFTANNFNILSGSTLTIDSGATITNSGTANGFGLTLADQFRLTSDFTGDANPITSNLERVDTTGQGTIGTMTNSSGTFSFPATGIYYVSFTLSIYVNSSNSRMDFRIKSTTDNSSYNDAATGQIHGHADGDLAYMTSSIDTLIDVTNTSNDKVQFRVNNLHDANTVLSNTNSNVTYMTFIRLGDT
jgi:hypothetical protein